MLRREEIALDLSVISAVNPLTFYVPHANHKNGARTSHVLLFLLRNHRLVVLI